ncbi:MAG: CoA-transferase, partial [Propionicimonas sp.]|nr:CoA-transferase [Propionicimonas sp.]
MAKVIDMAGAVAKLSDGMSLMIGGFMGCGNAHHLVQAIIDAGLTDLTMISNDAAMPGYGVAKLVEHRRLKRLITSHVGLNPEV